MTNEKAIKFFEEQHKSPACFISLEEWRDFNDALDMAIEALRRQDVTDTNVGDMVSRKDVIELVKDSYYNLAESMEDTWAMVEDVERLPSAETQIIHCKDCKHYQFADNRAFGMPVKMCKWFDFEDVDDDDFCSRAERRTDGID